MSDLSFVGPLELKVLGQVVDENVLKFGEEFGHVRRSSGTSASGAGYIPLFVRVCGSRGAR
eukprot:760232-Hanusia_phi.AAC.1